MEHMKNVRSLTVAALLVALAVTLKFLKIVITPTLEFSFAFLANASAGFLFGPFVSGTVGALADVLGYLVRATGPFFPGFTLNAIINGVVYGLILYKKPLSMKRVVIARVINTVLISFLLNPLWLSMMYGKAFHLLVKTRFIKAAILFVPECILLFAILQLVQKIAMNASLLQRRSTSE